MLDCVYIALDGLSRERSLKLVKELSQANGHEVIAGFKIHDLWDTYGPDIVKELKLSGAKDVWLDLKLSDTPLTVELRSLAVAKSGADVISVHASCGADALVLAKKSGLKVVAITALTSLGESEVKKIFSQNVKSTVLNLYQIAKDTGVWGLVSSANELEFLSELRNSEMKFITPGIKELKVNDDNQKRVSTPVEAFQSGANYIVIGKEIARSQNPTKTFERIAKSILSI